MSDKTGLPTGKHTLVEQGTELKGTITSSVPIVVMGKVEGDISGPEIQVSASGTIAGNVKVKHLRSDGEIAGIVEAEAVRISGRVRDKTVIRARSLEVTLSSSGMEVTFGECELAIGDEPNKEAAIAAATAAPEAKKPEPRRNARPSEHAWDEAANVAKVEPAEDEPKRKRGTLPPPLT
jgi:cytoskeletal protein CcmA (bactofilin family)